MDKLVKICIVIVLAKQSSADWWPNRRISSSCTDSNGLECTNHKLQCQPGEQIYVSSAYYGFLRWYHHCPSYRKNCRQREDCCHNDHGDCGVEYTDSNMAHVYRCSGKQSCTLPSYSSNDRSTCRRPRKYNKKNSYTEILYKCVSLSVPSKSTIQSPQIVIDGSNHDKKCTYNVKSWIFLFYQTNTECIGFNIRPRSVAKCHQVYKIRGRTTFSIQPNQDIFIIIKGFSTYHTISVESDCYLPDEIAQEPTTTPPVYDKYTKTYVMDTTTEMNAADTKVPDTTTETPTDETTFYMDEIDEANNPQNKFENQNAKTEKLNGSTSEVITNNDKGSNLAVIIGSVVGGCIFILLIVIVAILVKRRKTLKTIEKPIHASNPGYGVAFVNTPYEDINPRINNSSTANNVQLHKQQNDDYNHLADLNVQEFMKEPIDSNNDNYNHLAATNGHAFKDNLNLNYNHITRNDDDAFEKDSLGYGAYSNLK